MKENIFFWQGENFLIDEKIFQWKKIFLEKHGELNFEKLIFPADNFKTIITAIQSPPFLAEKRLVVIKGLPYSSEMKEGEKFSDIKKNNKENSELEEFLEILEKIQKDTIIVFASGKADKRTKIFKGIENIANKEIFSHPDKKIFEWVKNFCDKEKIFISKENILFFLSLSGKNLYNITNELKKLKNFSYQNGDLKNSEISKSDIEKNILNNSEVNIFKITALVGAGKNSEAYLELQNLMRGGEDIHYIFNLIIRQFRLLLGAFDLKNLSSGEIGQALGIAPFAASSLKNQVHNFSLEKLLEKNKKCYEIDKSIKNGAISGDEMLILNIEKELIF